MDGLKYLKILKIKFPKNDDLEEAVHQEIVDMKLLLSRKLGVKVKTNNENPSKRIVNDIKKAKNKEFSLYNF